MGFDNKQLKTEQLHLNAMCEGCSAAVSESSKLLKAGSSIREGPQLRRFLWVSINQPNFPNGRTERRAFSGECSPSGWMVFEETVLQTTWSQIVLGFKGQTLHFELGTEHNGEPVEFPQYRCDMFILLASTSILVVAACMSWGFPESSDVMFHLTHSLF